jgi:Iap family predicted aminopeptidase
MKRSDLAVRAIPLLILATTALNFAAVAQAPTKTATSQTTLKLVPTSELLGELKAAPKPNTQRQNKLLALFRQAGARPADIRLQQVWPLQNRRNSDPVLNNIIVTKKGTTPSVIVVGAHFDKVAPGSGIIDNWSGAAMLANLYQTLRPLQTRHTFQFVGFAYEEQGTLGSRDFLVPLLNSERRRIKAMVNFECLGVDRPFLWTNGSHDKLEDFARSVATANKLPLLSHEVPNVSSDSAPFARYGIPVIGFDGLAVEKLRLIHSERDQFSAINATRYSDTYKLLTQFLIALDKR